MQAYLGFKLQVQLTCFDFDFLSLWVGLDVAGSPRRVPSRWFRYNLPILDAGICLGGTYGGFHGCTQLG